MTTAAGRPAPEPNLEPVVPIGGMPAPAPRCRAEGQNCETGRCCAGTECVLNDDGTRACQLLCTDAGDCASGCCVPLTDGTASACGPARYCPPPPQSSGQNGASCTEDSDCDSFSCKLSNGGERYCYGYGAANVVCTSPFECETGYCFAATLEMDLNLCTPSVELCRDRGFANECIRERLIACARLSACDEVSDEWTRAKNDHDFCMERLCNSDGVDEGEESCRAKADAILDGQLECPVD